MKKKYNLLIVLLVIIEIGFGCYLSLTYWSELPEVHYLKVIEGSEFFTDYGK